MSACLATPCVAGEGASPGAGVDYLRDVKPVLSKRCYVCHGALKQNAGLRLDTAASIRKGGDGGPAVEPGKSDESLLVEAISGREGWKMPPEGEGTALSTEEIKAVETWIEQGAVAPADERPMADPRKHWSFRPPVRPARAAAFRRAGRLGPQPGRRVPRRRHEQRGLDPAPPAAPGVLIRRVYLDLIGLVPTPEEVRAFVADPSDRAYEEIVDRLLASPQYGERWGRHWMDVWRYSDWDGYGAEVRESQPHIWRWRDWIVESLNADKGYDRMVVEMLAADEAAPDDPAALRATGFLVRNWYKFNRNVWLDDTVEHTSKAFLGLTLNCAKCHDHKYDPIAQTEYYRFRAFFEPHTTRTDPVPGQPDTAKDGLVRVYDGEPGRQDVRLHARRREAARAGPAAGPGRPARARASGEARPDRAGLPAARPPITPASSSSSESETLDAGRRSDSRLARTTLARPRRACLGRERPGCARQGPRRPSQLGRKAVEAARGQPGFRSRRGSRPTSRYAAASLPGPTRASLARAAAKAERLADKHDGRGSPALRRAGAGRRRTGRPGPESQDGRRRSARRPPTPRPSATRPGPTSSRRARRWRRTTRTIPPLGPVYPRPARAAGSPWRAGSSTARIR